jgi:micrococcal nuclease
MKIFDYKKIFFLLFIATWICISVDCIRPAGEAVFNSPYVTPSDGEWALVTKIVDGDTIYIEGDRKVRYIGMDTPETHHPTKGLQPYGKEATEANRRLVEGRKVLLVKDVSETDRYGRLLRYVFLPDGTFVNLKLVEDGYARVATFPPDVKFADLFLKAERNAREGNRGLWGVEETESK